MGNRAARSIDAYFQGKGFDEMRIFEGIDTASQRGGVFFPERRVAGEPSLEGRGRLDDFAEIERGFTQAEAMEEARRCLRCYRLMVWEVEKSRQETTQGRGK